MDASKLTPEQGKRLNDAVAPMVGYTYKLAHWMQRMGWDPTDAMYVKAWESKEAKRLMSEDLNLSAFIAGEENYDVD
jgi:hypothetical protein